jgi:hypothetical protein
MGSCTIRCHRTSDLFGSSLMRCPPLVQLNLDRPEALRQVVDLPDLDVIMNRILALGIYPAHTVEMLKAEIMLIQAFVRAKLHG